MSNSKDNNFSNDNLVKDDLSKSKKDSLKLIIFDNANHDNCHNNDYPTFQTKIDNVDDIGNKDANQICTTNDSLTYNDNKNDFLNNVNKELNEIENIKFISSHNEKLDISIINKDQSNASLIFSNRSLDKNLMSDKNLNFKTKNNVI